MVRSVFRTIARLVKALQRKRVMLTKNNSVIGKSVLLHRCLIMRKYVPVYKSYLKVFTNHTAISRAAYGLVLQTVKLK